MTIEFKFEISSKVWIKAIEEVGFVEMACHSASGNDYKVAYWINGNRESKWLYEWELAPLPKK